MRDVGCSLAALEVSHPDPRRVSALLESLAFRDHVAISIGERPAVVAHFQTPSGPRSLGVR
jgi:hypothetical protein